jgi:hypothetical protein
MSAAASASGWARAAAKHSNSTSSTARCMFISSCRKINRLGGVNSVFNPADCTLHNLRRPCTMLHSGRDGTERVKAATGVQTIIQVH